MNNTKPSLTAIVLTYNEEIHLARCLNSLKGVCKHIVIVDSYSTDKTKEIALINGAEFYQNKFVNHSTQFNWALDNCDIKSNWILRMDADEYLMPDLQKEIIDKLSGIKEPINGVEFYLRRVFLGKHMKRGLGKIKMMRLFRFRKARIENRWMDEHAVLLEGNSITFNGEFADDNLNSIGWWSAKHNGYSIREAIVLLDLEYSLFSSTSSEYLSKQAVQKRNQKLKYVKMPLFFRCFIYFIYRYFFSFGFLDGKEGFLWHFLQGLWYRTLVDAKIFEIKKNCGSDINKIKLFIKKKYNIEV